MLSILLINNNKIVSRLLQLSSQKHNYNLEESEDYTHQKDGYNVVFIDSELFDEEKTHTLIDEIRYDKLGYLGEKGSAKPEIFELMLEKPFLPTDFVNLMEEHFKVVDPSELEGITFEEESIDSLEDELDLDSLEEITSDDELDLDALMADSGTSQETSDEISDITNEIEEIDELDEAINKPSVNEIEESVEDEPKDKFDKEMEQIVDENLIRESLQEAMVDESKDETALNTAALGAAAMASAVAASTTSHESENSASMVDEFANIDEKGIKEALLGERDELSTDTMEISEDISTLESNEIKVEESSTSTKYEELNPTELEQIISRAVSKALTKEMIQEALKDMEIVVTLKSRES